MYRKDWSRLNIHFLKSQSFFGKEIPNIPANKRQDLKIKKALKNFNIDMTEMTKNKKYLKYAFQDKGYLSKKNKLFPKAIILFLPS